MCEAESRLREWLTSPLESSLTKDKTYRQRAWTFINEQVGPEKFHSAVKVTDQESSYLQNRSFSRTALEIQVVDQFWRIYLPQDAPNTIYIGAIVKTPWKRAVQALCLQDRWVSIALQACAFMVRIETSQVTLADGYCTQSLGRLQHNQSYVQYGQQLYGRALRETNNAIRDPTRAQSDGTLASCKLLGMYESFRLEEDSRPSTQGNDWQRHVDGTCRIVQLRGPEMAASDYGHDLFTDARIAAAMAGITQKRSSGFFTNSAWTTVPWTRHPKTLRDELFDLVVMLPDSLQQQEALYEAMSNATGDAAVNKVIIDGIHVLKQCMSLGTKLRIWEQKTISLARDARMEESDRDLTLFKVSKDHGFAFFYLVTIFWTACLLNYGSTWLTYQRISCVARNAINPPTDDLSTIEIPCWMNPEPYAAYISKISSHFFSEQAGLWGSSAASLPLGAALHYYAATGSLQSPECSMLKSALGSSAKAGMVSGFLRSMAASAAPDGGDPKNPVEHEKMATTWFGSTAR